jgi:hypothetical protein
MRGQARGQLVGLPGAADSDLTGSPPRISHPARCVYSDDGHRLSDRRHDIPDAPRLASPGIWRMARDRWVEAPS